MPILVGRAVPSEPPSAVCQFWVGRAVPSEPPSTPRQFWARSSSAPQSTAKRPLPGHCFKLPRSISATARRASSRVTRNVFPPDVTSNMCANTYGLQVVSRTATACHLCGYSTLRLLSNQHDACQSPQHHQTDQHSPHLTQETPLPNTVICHYEPFS